MVLWEPEMANILENIRTMNAVISQDPGIFQDVKSRIEKQFPHLEDQGDTIMRSVSGIKPQIEGIEKRPDIAALIRTNANINMVISPEFIRRPPKDSPKNCNLFLSTLAGKTGEMNYSFGMRYNDAAKILFHYVAIPSHELTSKHIYDILEDSKQKLMDSISNPFDKILIGCSPKCTATAVYNKISPFVIWELVWDLRDPEYIIYMQELDQLMLHNDIPIIGAPCGEVFLSLVTDREIPRSDDDSINMEELLKILTTTENRIKEKGFLINSIYESINLVPYPCRELASMGLFIRHNGEIKSLDLVLRDLTKLTNEQFIRGEQLQNKKQVLDSLLKSFIHILRHPDQNIYSEYQNIVSVKSLAKEYSISREEIKKKIRSN